MHACELVHLAAAAAGSAQTLIRSSFPPSAASLEQYWSASKERLDSWTREFASHAPRGDKLPACPSSLHTEVEELSDCATPSLRPFIEEVLLSEVLTRVWTAIAVAQDRLHSASLAAPIARSIFIGHQEARNRALSAILHSHGLARREPRRLNLLRQKCERWNDLLLAHAGLDELDCAPLAFDPQRVADFADDLLHEQQAAGELASKLTLASLHAALRRGLVPHSPHGELNRRIAGGVMSCYPSDLLDATGPLTSLWQMRIEHTTTDTQGWVEELLSLD